MNYPYSKKSWVSLTLAAVMLTSVGVASAASSATPTAPQAPKAPVAATNTTPQPAAENPLKAEKLTIEQAVEQALATNSTLTSLRLDIKTADINARLVHETVKDIPSDLIESLDAAQRKYVDDAKGQVSKKLNALSLKATESKIKVGVQKSYYDLLFAQSQLDLKKQSLKRAETQLKVAKAAVEVGTRAKTDVLQAEMGLSGAQAALASAQNEVEIARLNLNQMMGVDLKKQWVLVDVNNQVAASPLSLDDATAKALKDRMEMTQKQEEINIAQLNTELIAKYSALSTYKGQVARNEVEKAKLHLEDQKKSIVVEVTQAYNSLNTSKLGMEFKKKAKESAAESYRLTNLRFENGLATTLEVIQSEEELTDRENQYQQAIYLYNLAAMNYKTALGD